MASGGEQRVITQPLPARNKSVSTVTGCGALFIWAMYAFLVSELLASLPVFETICMSFGINFIVTAIRLTIMKQWGALKQPLFVWLIGVAGVCGSDFTYIAAMQYAPPAHVDFIDYLWPFLLIIGTSFLPNERFTPKHLIGGGLALGGVCFLLTNGQEGSSGFQWSYLQGYLYAFIAACIWCSYTLFSRWYQKMPSQMVGIYYGIGSLIAFTLHRHHEVFVKPSAYEMMLILILGLSSGIASLLWLYGSQKGNVKLLGVLAYCTPMMSMMMLVYAEKEPFSSTLVMACILFILGILVGSIDWQNLKLKWFGAERQTEPAIYDK